MFTKIYLTVLIFPLFAAPLLIVPVDICWVNPNLIQSDIILPYVEIRNNFGVGSGVVISHNNKNVVLTANHIIQQCLTDGKFTERVTAHKEDLLDELQYIYGDESTDIALLSLSMPDKFSPAHINKDILVEIGEDAWYIGTSHKIHQCLEKSIINNNSHSYKGVLSYLVNGCGYYGGSGGGLFVKRNRYYLVGIIQAKYLINGPMISCRLIDILNFLEKCK